MSKKNCDEKIDFVITWVDGNDPEWRAERDKYSKKNDGKIDNRENRYRDWENLQYLFRGIEKFAPWVNNVFFITCGHLPKWLNIENPKLKVVKHEDYIPKEYLPTFNSNTIELSMHKIKGLSENFVYFNDDMFLTRSVKKEDFFKDGKPCDCAILSPIISLKDNGFASCLANNMSIINTYFDKKECIKKDFFKWFNLKYGKELFRNICLIPWKNFPGFLDKHTPLSFNKKTFEILWNKEKESLVQTSKSRFRDNYMNLNIWLCRYWQLVTGKFYPKSKNNDKYFFYTDNNEEIYEAIENQKYKMICLNDVEGNYNFEEEKRKTIEAFEKILPDKCSFEK